MDSIKENYTPEKSKKVKKSKIPDDSISILRKSKGERKLIVGDSDFKYHEGCMIDSEVYEKCKNWIPSSCNPSIIEFRKRYVRETLKLPVCLCGFPAYICTVRKKTSPNVGKEFYGCVMYPGSCGFFEYVDPHNSAKNALYRKIKAAHITKADMRTGLKRGFFGDPKDEPKIKKLRIKLEESGIKNEEFLQAKELGLY